MGVLNLTPDSFFSSSRHSRDSARRQAAIMAKEGADILDIGGESTRPGSLPVSPAEELDRVLPLVEALRREVALPLSVDTTKSAVAKAALQEGAEFVNDISGLRFDAAMASVVAEAGGGLMLMHTRGRPEGMQQDTRYDDLLEEIRRYLQAGVAQARGAGIAGEKLAIDPGIGFGKDTEGNLEILARLGELRFLGLPLLIGTSRKGFIGKILDQPSAEQRLFGSLATVALAVAAGADILRVHDVGPSREVALVAWAVRQAGPIG